MEAWVGVAKAVAAREASCKGGRRFERTPGMMQDHRWSWEEEEAGSWAGVQGSPVCQAVWGKVGAQGTGSGNRDSGTVLAEGTA